MKKKKNENLKWLLLFECISNSFFLISFGVGNNEAREYVGETQTGNRKVFMLKSGNSVWFHEIDTQYNIHTRWTSSLTSITPLNEITLFACFVPYWHRHIQSPPLTVVRVAVSNVDDIAWTIAISRNKWIRSSKRFWCYESSISSRCHWLSGRIIHKMPLLWPYST